MQKTELCFIIKAKMPTDKYYKSLIKIPTGVLQKNYTMAYQKALDTVKSFESTGLKCKLITKYLPLQKSHVGNQLKLGV
jgi:hypothetical protein